MVVILSNTRLFGLSWLSWMSYGYGTWILIDQYKLRVDLLTLILVVTCNLISTSTSVVCNCLYKITNKNTLHMLAGA